jgi:hypothetical protein
MNKVKKDLEGHMKVVIPSLKVFLDSYNENLIKGSAVLDSKNVLNMNEKDRYQYLIGKFNEIASKALLEALIESGYKREDKKKWKMNWF